MFDGVFELDRFISDTHFGDPSVGDVKYDCIIARWNRFIGKDTRVFIIGDFIHRDSEKSADYYASRLNGRLYLIPGNHDLCLDSSDKLNKCACIHTTHVQQRKVILCHYPLYNYESNYDHFDMHLYGHIHDDRPEDFMYLYERGHNYNAYAEWLNYIPRTLDEIIDINIGKYKDLMVENRIRIGEN